MLVFMCRDSGDTTSKVSCCVKPSYCVFKTKTHKRRNTPCPPCPLHSRFYHPCSFLLVNLTHVKHYHATTAVAQPIHLEDEVGGFLTFFSSLSTYFTCLRLFHFSLLLHLDPNRQWMTYGIIVLFMRLWSERTVRVLEIAILMLLLICPKHSHWKWAWPENENTVNLKSASFYIIMRLHEGLTHIHSQKSLGCILASFTLTDFLRKSVSFTSQ